MFVALMVSFLDYKIRGCKIKEEQCIKDKFRDYCSFLVDPLKIGVWCVQCMCAQVWYV